MEKSRDIIEVVCDVCGKTYKTIAKEWRFTEKRGKKHCCSMECRKALQKTGKMVKCLCCGKEIYRSKKLLRDDGVYYCSQECAHKCINHSHDRTEEQKKKTSESIKEFLKTEQFQELKKLRKEKAEANAIKKICPVCEKNFSVQNWNKKRIYCSKECYLQDSKLKFRKKTPGGLRTGTSRAHHGWYKGYYCDSSWELAFVIYNLDHNISFQRNHQGFEYEYDGEKHKYYPDFILNDGSFVEIKGYMGKQNEVKISSFNSPLIIIRRKEIKPYLDYVKLKYGNDFIRLFEK